MNDNPDREVAVFNIARNLPASERANYLDETCTGDAMLRQRVEELLLANQEAGDFLKGPAGGAEMHLQSAVSSRAGGSISASTFLAEKPGDKIGRYKLLEQIGEGGCGVVYMAEQEEPVRRKVALKIIKLGMDTKNVIARFEAERQALAMMDHPNIAKVLDAGATETGRPFFVMELVRGTKITDYCDENNFSTRQRLELFNQVCRAIQHAHQKGIVHRDIKPSNILVTLHDGEPMPMVIDFGIAKATGGLRLTDRTVFTAFEQFLGTPAYMSPEQAQLTNQDIDTRSDIYSLGVLLYELLTSKTPFETKELLQVGLEAMLRTIREVEPARPSTRLSAMLKDELTTTAKHRQMDAPKLVQLLGGDLDWIVMKCLEKNRARRYETANGLAVDIQRHLSNEPVVARPPSNLYRFQKMVRRNKLAFAAVSAVFASLLIGLGVSTWLFLKERTARRQADTEVQNRAQVARFLKDMLGGVKPSVALGRDTTMLREILDKTAERVGKELGNQPEVEAELKTTLGEVYRALGQYAQGEAMHREALALREKLFGRAHLKVANSLYFLADSLLTQGRPAEAEPLLREAVAIQRKFLGDGHRGVAQSMANLANVLAAQGKLTEAELVYRDALARRRKLLGNENMEVAWSLYNLASFLCSHGRLSEAEPFAREALTTRRKLFSNNDPTVADSLVSLAMVLYRQGKAADAEPLAREALKVRRSLFGDANPTVAETYRNLVEILAAQGKPPDLENAPTGNKSAAPKP